ncbi:MAG TPA: DUF2585 family protein [Pyrinomonadaceae bacterium]|nr:DUF2585 family protein [Pyrinomonadaceae bacterium]
MDSSDARHEGTRGALTRKAWPLASVAVATAAAFVLRAQGRTWLCDCGRVRAWVGDAWSAETSQQLFDPYTFTHVLHGLAFCGLLALLLPRVGWRRRFVLAVAAEALWEVIENTDIVIRRYREATAALGYTGDTVVNSLGDMAACAVGFLVARRLGRLRSALLFAATEILLLFWIRDGLVLNIILLLYPSERMRAWQQAGH